MRTKEFKNTLFEKNKTILEILYHLGNGLMLKEQLIRFIKFIEPLKTNVKEDIEELVIEGFLGEKQVLWNNKYMVYLKKYPIARIRGIESRNATSIRPTEEKVLNSLYKTEILLNMLNPKGEYSIENILVSLQKMNNTLLVNKNNALNVYSLLEENLKDANPTSTFENDKKTIHYDTKMRFKKDNECIDKNLKIAKEQTVKLRQKANTKVNELKEYFNISNMLSRGFNLNKVTYNHGKMEITLQYLDLTEGDTDKIFFGIGCIYNMFLRYFKGAQSDFNSSFLLTLNINCIINTSNSDRLNFLQEDEKSKVPDLNGGYKEYKKGKNALIRAGVPQMYLDDIQVLYRNLDFQNKYNIDLSI